MNNLKVGDRVILVWVSENWGGVPDTSNPVIGTKYFCGGRVIESYLAPYREIKVRWDNGDWNRYWPKMCKIMKEW